MTKDQITTYEFCNKHLKFIKEIREKMPFGIQKYGCSTSSPGIEHTLERIHNKMYDEVHAAITKAEKEVEKLIEEA